MKIKIKVDIEAEEISEEEEADIEDAVVDICKEWGHKAEAIVIQEG